MAHHPFPPIRPQKLNVYVLPCFGHIKPKTPVFDEHLLRQNRPPESLLQAWRKSLGLDRDF
jgi:hypothetical protein